MGQYTPPAFTFFFIDVGNPFVGLHGLPLPGAGVAATASYKSDIPIDLYTKNLFGHSGVRK